MKKVIIRNYDIETNKNNINNIKIALISDIHFSSFTKMNTLYKVKNYIDSINPDYICIVGDIIDGLNFIENENLINNLYEWIYKIGIINNKKIPVLVSLGNHDISYCKDMQYKNKYDFRSVEDFKIFISKLNHDNVYLLDNSTYEDKYIYASGFTIPANAFHTKKAYQNELKYFKKVNGVLVNPPNNRYNIALIHSPINIMDSYIKNKLYKYDLILSGHMHNGMVFDILDKIIKNNKGIISPNKKWFPKISRGIINIDNDRYLIISGGITKLQWCAGILKYGDILYPSHIENINIKKYKKKQS